MSRPYGAPGPEVRACVICGELYIPGFLWTCSQECHKQLIDRLVTEFGEYKKVVDAKTGRAYQVPTRDILEHGLRHQDLAKYPLWREQP